AAAPKKKAPAPKKKAPAADRPGLASSSRATRASALQPGSVPDWVIEAFGPTLRVYAEEEAHVLSIAATHPALGERFVREAAERTSDRVPKRDLAAFREAMARVDVEGRVRAVVRKLEKAWGTALDDETRDHVRDDVLAMYLGA
ncbi:MAG: hypothetical protein KC657_00655, partial [Myxococcales bacterium]|nr:hypothetical protein [Myxococcales bacterium]